VDSGASSNGGSDTQAEDLGTTRVTVGIPTYNRSSWLREAMESVLAQSYEDFRLLICDNASEDGTRDMVESFRDERIVYSRSPRNIGMVPNFNRVMNLTDTEYLMVLPDDDALYPDYLRSTVAVLDAHPSVGVVHTGFDVVDHSSTVLHGGLVMPGSEGFEPRERFLERIMSTPIGAVCWSSALLRTRAMVDADGQRPSDEPYADFPLLMRIALGWDYFSLAAPLVRLRVHEESGTAALGSFIGGDYYVSQQPTILFDHRMRFLEEARLEPERDRRYRALAKRAYLEGSVETIAARARLGARWTSTAVELARVVRRHPRTLTVGSTWRLIGAQLGGRRAKRAALRVLERAA